MPRSPQPLAVASLAFGTCLTAACGAGPGEPVGPPTSAVAAPSCGSTDGPAVGITVASALDAAGAPRPPYVSVTVARLPGELAGRTYGFGDDGVVGAVRQPADDNYEVATRGTVTVRRVGADTTIDGALDLTFPSGARVRQAFRAAWRPHRGGPLCG